MSGKDQVVHMKTVFFMVQLYEEVLHSAERNFAHAIKSKQVDSIPYKHQKASLALAGVAQ